MSPLSFRITRQRVVTDLVSPISQAQGSYFAAGSPFTSLFPASNCSCYFSECWGRRGGGVTAGLSHLDNVFLEHY